MADDDLDFVVGLGDYIHAEVYNTVAAGTTVRDDPIGVHNPHQPSVARQAETLGAYRAKYTLYGSDRALRRMRQTLPMIAV